MKQKLWLWIFCLLMVPAVYAQQGAGLQGRIADELTGDALSGVVVRLLQNNVSATTDTDGAFYFENLNMGTDVLIVSGATIATREVPVNIPQDNVVDLGEIRVTQQSRQDVSLVMNIDESLIELDEDGGGGLSQDVSSMVIFSNDIFLRNAGYQFSQFGYRTRGYESRFEERYINGVSFNDQIRGVFNYASIGALNDVTRNGDAANFYNPSMFSFGSISGSENINMRAGSYTQGGKATMSLTNRNYYSRLMATYSTGLRDDGWAVTASVGGRYSHEGHIEGVFYRNISYALGVEKRWDEGRHSLSFMTFGSPVERGQQGSSYQEVYDLVGNNLYNPNWGYQNGKKRNSKVVKAIDPTAILSHVWEINDNTNLTTGVAAHYARYGASALNWYNGPDPRPDYYRYLPSYNEANDLVNDYYKYLWEDTKSKDRISQLNWDKMWEANYINNKEGNGSAIYMVEERRSDLFELAFNSTLNTKVTDNVKLTAGIGGKKSLAKQFKTVDDLLGAQYLLDIDKFAERDFPGNQETVQNNLNKPGRRVYEGDVFGYDFRYHVNSADIWFQQEHTYRQFDLYYGAKLKYTGFQREGMMRNGRYPDNSFGKAKTHNFMDYGAKLGATYKFTGRHFLSGNVIFQTAAPLVDKAYISPRITDKTAENLKSMKMFSADLNYIFSFPSISGRVSVFNTQFFDDLMRVSYYHDSERTFVNHVLSGVQKSHRGVEVGLNYRLDESWNFDLIGTVADYVYDNNPTGVISYENGKKDNITEQVYMKNIRVGGTTQSIGTFGINYFYRYWFLNMNVNAFGRNYIEAAPFRRMASNYVGITPPGTEGFDESLYEAYEKLTTQERLGSGYTIDLGIGKIWYISDGKSINFNLSVNNILNNQNVRTGGYEQGRLSLEYPDRFASKYFYMQGINAFFNASYRF